MSEYIYLAPFLLLGYWLLRRELRELRRERQEIRDKEHMRVAARKAYELNRETPWRD